MSVVRHQATLQKKEKSQVRDLPGNGSSRPTLRAWVIGSVIDNFGRAAKIQSQGRTVIIVTESLGNIKGVLTNLIVCCTNELLTELNCYKDL